MQMGIELCERGSQRLVRDVLEDGGAEFLVGCGESGGAFDFARRRLAFDRARYPIDFLRPEFLCRDAHGCRFEELAHLYDVAKFRGRGEGDHIPPAGALLQKAKMRELRERLAYWRALNVQPLDERILGHPLTRRNDAFL